MTQFVCSDHHFSHSKMWEVFKREDGSPLRSFSSNEEMDETIIKNHNNIVSSNDTVYFLGDVVMRKQHLSHVSRMNGRKILLLGNHDIFHVDEYRNYFDDVRAFMKKGNFIFTHVPIHPESMYEKDYINVHGHTHWNLVMKNGVPDKKYLNVCMERINYTPVSFETLKEIYNERFGD